MADAVEKVKALRELSDGVARLVPGTNQWVESLKDTILKKENAEPLELTEEQVHYMSIATGVSTGVIAFWIMNNPEIVKTFLEQMGEMAKNLVPDISLIGGSE